MNRTTVVPQGRRLRRAIRAMGRPALVLIAAIALALPAVSPASAYWSATGSASGAAMTDTLAPPTGVTVPTTAVASVPVSWTAATGSLAPEGYFVTRSIDPGGTVAVAACSTSPGMLTTATSCADPVAAGAYRYTVTAVYRSWMTAGTPSGIVTVSAPSVLGAAQSYSVLAATAVVSTLTTVVSGDLGVSPGTTVTGFGPGVVGGDVHAGDAHAADAQVALAAALSGLSTRTPDAEIVGDLGGRTLTPGTYHSVAALALTGTLTLDAQGHPNAVFLFQTDAAFNTAAASTVVLANGAQPDNVFWVVTAAAGTGANSLLHGSVLARAAVTIGAGTVLIGRALSQDAVTLAGNTIRFTAALPPSLAIDGGPVAVARTTTPTISGTSNAGISSPIRVTIAGQTLHTGVVAGGVWSVTAAMIPAGTHPMIAKVRDPAGNGTAASQSLTVEVSPSPVALGAAGSCSVLAGTAVVNTGSTTLSGDLGVSPGTVVTGFPPGTLAGAIHAGDPTAATARADLFAAIVDGSSRAPHTEIIGDLGGRTFHVGVHHSTAALAITGTLTLDAQGDPGGVFIFQTDAAFDTAAASTVVLAGGAQASNVFWVVTGAAGTGANSFLSGTILARGAITFGASTSLAGQALSLDTITLAASSVNGAVPAPAHLAALTPPAEPGSVELGWAEPSPVEPTTAEPNPAEPTAVEPTPVEPSPAAPTPIELSPAVDR